MLWQVCEMLLRSLCIRLIWRVSSGSECDTCVGVSTYSLREAERETEPIECAGPPRSRLTHHWVHRTFTPPTFPRAYAEFASADEPPRFFNSAKIGV